MGGYDIRIFDIRYDESPVHCIKTDTYQRFCVSDNRLVALKAKHWSGSIWNLDPFYHMNTYSSGYDNTYFDQRWTVRYTSKIQCNNSMMVARQSHKSGAHSSSPGLIIYDFLQGRSDTIAWRTSEWKEITSEPIYGYGKEAKTKEVTKVEKVMGSVTKVEKVMGRSGL